MVRNPFELLRAVSPSTLLGTLRFSKGNAEPLTMNGTSETYDHLKAFALMDRGVNATFYETIQ